MKQRLKNSGRDGPRDVMTGWPRRRIHHDIELLGSVRRYRIPGTGSITQVPSLVSARRLFCAVGAIASIPQTRDYEPSLIESIVDGRSPKTNIGMKPTHPLHSLLSGNQTDATDVLCPAFLDAINGGSGCIAGCQHRRHDDHEPLRKVGRSFEKIFDCNECIGIAVKPNMRDTCSRHEFEHAFHECHAGSKNWRKNKFLSSDSRR